MKKLLMAIATMMSIIIAWGTDAYIVIDVSGGVNASSYPVFRIPTMPEGGWTDEYKQNKIVLRRVEAGCFMMGDETKRDNQPHFVRLTRSFYIGVFQVTQRQFEHVTGLNPAKSPNMPMVPVEHVSYNDIRGGSCGSAWPLNNCIDAKSFLGMFRQKTGLAFDLPTEAQWEYACRAGTSTWFYSGDSADDLARVGWCYDNSDGHAHEVGLKQPNSFGLYDMHGNVWEWCLDWYCDVLKDDAVDPIGPSHGTDRVLKGGCWDSDLGGCASWQRDFDSPNQGDSIVGDGPFGFRLCLVEDESDTFLSSYGPFVPGEKVSLTIPAFIGYAAKGLPSGLKLDNKTGEITGAAKKPTGEAGVTVTFTKKNEPTLTAQFVVGPIPTISVTLEGDTEKCKVTGANKAYLVGKKVSLQAKGPKGTAFVGWFRDGEPWPSEEEFLEPKIKYVMMAEDLNLVARFKAEEVSVVCDTAAGCVVKENVSFPVIVDCESGLKSVSAKNLPGGLKYNKKTGCIEGAAKKAGTYPFSLTVTTKAGSKVTQDFTLAVLDAEGDKYPDWMVGTFSGGMKDMFYQDREHRHFICADYAVGTLTVSPTGKCSMRWEGIDGVGDENDYFKPLTFSGEILDVSDSECHIRIIVPGEDDNWIVTIRKLSFVGHEVGAYIDHFIPTDTGEYELDYDRFVQNIWVRQDMQGKLAEIGLAQTSGFAVSDSSGLFANTHVTVSADGQVKLSGTVNGSSVSATGNLIPCDASVGAETFEAYFIVTSGKEHYPVKMLFVGQGGTWNVSAVDFDE